MPNTLMPTFNTTGIRRLNNLAGIPTNMNQGVRRLSTLGAWGLGSAVDSSTVADLVANGGYDMGVIDNLVNLGASNEQLLALPYPASQQEMQNAVIALTNQLSSVVTAPNIVRAGSQLSYTATWGNTFTGWNDPNAIQVSIQGVLSAQWGIVVDSQFHTTSDIINTSGQSGFTMQLHTTRDYGSAGDVKSIVDGALNGAGVSLRSSTIATTVSVSGPLSTGTPGGPGPLPSGVTAPMNWSLWLQQNLPVLLFGLAAVVIVPPLLRRR